MHEVLKKIEAIGIVPVVKIDRAEDAVPLARALINGGLPCAEVTFRTDAAADAIAAMTKEFPEMLVGAGTVLTPEQADAAVQAGAKFIVSPGLNPDVVRHCVERGYPVTPGVCTPGEVETALSFGLEVVKFFPAEAAGGLAMIKAMSAPYGKLKFMPTGGINAKNINEYLAFPKILACGGSWMVTPELINAGRFDEIERLTREAVMTMLGFELAHIGINAQDAEEADGIATAFGSVFDMEKKTGNSSIFVDTILEVMKTPGYGAKGHIAIRTKSITRAVQYLEAKGVKMNHESAKTDAAGKLVAIYLQDEFGGFAVHLVQA